MIIDHIRDLNEFKTLYESRPMPAQYDFNWLVNNPNLFCFYEADNGKLLGFITVQKEELIGLGKCLTLSGTAIKGIMPKIITAIIIVCNAFNEDMYSLTPLKEAGLVLRRAGFEKVQENIYKRVKHG